MPARNATAFVSNPFSDSFKLSENGGRNGRVERERNPKSHSGGAAPTGRSASVDPAERTRAPALVRGAEHGGSRATGVQAGHSPLAGEWADKHRAALRQAEQIACAAALRSGKPWTLHADQQTRTVLTACPDRSNVSDETAAEYRKVYERLRESGRTPFEAATTRHHFDKLRTAARFCMEQDINALRAASERARKRNDIDSAQRRTERAFHLAVVMDELFIQPGRLTWKDKPLSERGPSKSKRRTATPPPDMAGAVLLTGRRQGTKVGDRHAMRLAILSLTGCRPAELRKGVLVQTTDCGRFLTVQIRGAKVNAERGQKARVIRVPIAGSSTKMLASEAQISGGRLKISTTDADYRSLNRALQKAGVSCYSFRHQVASELKEAVSTGEMPPQEAAAVMGHRSTESLSYYGTRSKSRGGRPLRANATNHVKVVPVDYAARAIARATRKASQGDALRFPPRPRPLAAPKAAPASNVRPNRTPKPPSL